MSMISKRLNDLIGKDIEKVVEDLKLCNRQLVYNWLKGKNLPNIDHICKLADYYKVSLDYILGRNDDLTEIVANYPSNFHIRFDELIDSKSISKYKLFKNLQMSKGLQYAWFTKKNLPSLDNIIKIADYLCVSIDYLLGRI